MHWNFEQSVHYYKLYNKNSLSLQDTLEVTCKRVHAFTAYITLNRQETEFGFRTVECNNTQVQDLPQLNFACLTILWQVENILRFE